MNYLILGFSLFVIFIRLSSSNFMADFNANMMKFNEHMKNVFGDSDSQPEHFMAGFESGMKQFENNMQQFNQKMKNIFGDSGQHHHRKHGGTNWLKKFSDPKIPVFPQNFPFPPQCTRVENIPGLEFASPDDGINININTYPPQPVTTSYEYVTFECTDHRYPDSFYMLKSTVHFQVGRSGSSSGSSSGKVKYYYRTGEEFTYQPEIMSKPLWD